MCFQPADWDYNGMQPAAFLELFSCGSGCMLRGTRRFDMVALADELKLKLELSKSRQLR